MYLFGKTLALVAIFFAIAGAVPTIEDSESGCEWYS